MQMQALTVASEQPRRVDIYTDGACSGNRRHSARASAGVGVYFGRAHPLNYSAPLRRGPHTNQRAELEALVVALERIEAEPSLRGGAAEVAIWSDSQYSIDCVTKWCRAWERNGWRTASGKPVENQDLIRPLIAQLARQPHVALRKVAGHAGVEGNEAADALARAGVAARPHRVNQRAPQATLEQAPRAPQHRRQRSSTWRGADALVMGDASPPSPRRRTGSPPFVLEL